MKNKMYWWYALCLLIGATLSLAGYKLHDEHWVWNPKNFILLGMVLAIAAILFWKSNTTEE